MPSSAIDKISESWDAILYDFTYSARLSWSSYICKAFSINLFLGNDNAFAALFSLIISSSGNVEVNVIICIMYL